MNFEPQIYCPVCLDTRFVTRDSESRKAYPCPYCGKFVHDERKRFDDTPRRYGNPGIFSNMSYETFKDKRRADGFKPYPASIHDLTQSEAGRFKNLCGTYKEAHEKFCLAWARYGP